MIQPRRVALIAGIILALTSFSGSVHAQEEPVLTLPKALMRIRAYWLPQLRAGVIDAHAAEQLARTAYYPSLNVNIGESRSPLNESPGITVRRTQVTLSEHLIQVSNWVSMSARKADELAAEWNISSQIFSLLESGIQTFFDRLNTRQKIEIQERRIDRLERTVRLLKEVSRLGLVDDSERLAAESDLQAARVQLIELKSSLSLIDQDLKVAMGLGPEVVLQLSHTPGQESTSSDQKTEDWNHALERQPSIQALSNQRDAADLDRRSYALDWIPTVDANIGLTQVNAGSPNDAYPATPAQVSATLTLNWSIFDQGARNVRKAQATQQSERIQSQMSAKRIELSNKLHSMRQLRELQAQTVQLDQVRLKITTEAYESAWALFAIGKKSFTALQAIEGALITTELDSVEAGYRLEALKSRIQLWNGQF